MTHLLLGVAISAYHAHATRRVKTPKRHHNPRRVQRDVAMRQHPRLDPVPGTPIAGMADKDVTPKVLLPKSCIDCGFRIEPTASCATATLSPLEYAAVS